MKELIKRYAEEAAALAKYSLHLKEMIDNERNVDIVNDLRRRKRIIDSEWFEIMDDIRQMQA